MRSKLGASVGKSVVVHSLPVRRESAKPKRDKNGCAKQCSEVTGEPKPHAAEKCCYADGDQPRETTTSETENVTKNPRDNTEQQDSDNNERRADRDIKHLKDAVQAAVSQNEIDSHTLECRSTSQSVPDLIVFSRPHLGAAKLRAPPGLVQPGFPAAPVLFSRAPKGTVRP